jgi:hypothetical protein
MLALQSALVSFLSDYQHAASKKESVMIGLQVPGSVKPAFGTHQAASTIWAAST